MVIRYNSIYCAKHAVTFKLEGSTTSANVRSLMPLETFGCSVLGVMNTYVPLWTLIHTTQNLSLADKIIMHIMKTDC